MNYTPLFKRQKDEATQEVAESSAPGAPAAWGPAEGAPAVCSPKYS